MVLQELLQLDAVYRNSTNLVVLQEHLQLDAVYRNSTNLVVLQELLQLDAVYRNSTNLVVLQELLQLDAVFPLILLRLYGLEGVQDVEGAYVKLVHAQDNWITANYEGQVTEVHDTLCYSYRQLLLQVPRTLLQSINNC